MGEQILILKIELDPRIKKIRNAPVDPILFAPLNNINIAPVPVPAPPPEAAPALMYGNNVGHQYGSKENFRNTEKVEAFADDNNILSKLDREGLSAIKEILENFASICGLRCNVDKSQILIMGTDIIPVYVQESGFAIVDNLRILGFNVTKHFSDMKKNFEPTLLKIKKIIRFWERFRLSLPGRINVTKTLLMSQLSFHSSILEPDPEVLSEMQKAINSFVTGNFRFDKNMTTSPVNLGGLGIIDLNIYMQSLHCRLSEPRSAASITGELTCAN
jgi:hypothetical protein